MIEALPTQEIYMQCADTIDYILNKMDDGGCALFGPPEVSRLINELSKIRGYALTVDATLDLVLSRRSINDEP